MTESSPLPRAIQSADCNGTGGKWANLCSLGDYRIVSLSWRLIVGSLPPVSPSGISFSVLLAIIHQKKEGYSFGPKPRSSIICTRFPPAGFHSHLLLERRRPCTDRLSFMVGQGNTCKRFIREKKQPWEETNIACPSGPDSCQP